MFERKRFVGINLRSVLSRPEEESHRRCRHASFVWSLIGTLSFNAYERHFRTYHRRQLVIRLFGSTVKGDVHGTSIAGKASFPAPVVCVSLHQVLRFYGEPTVMSDSSRQAHFLPRSVESLASHEEPLSSELELDRQNG